MTLKTGNPPIKLEMPATSTLSDLMNQIRTWLDSQKIEPSIFKINRTDRGTVMLEIGFPTADTAASFQDKFAEGLPV